MSIHKTIGIVGGVGPYAGLDLNKNIFDQTRATHDQDHLRVVLFSASTDIPDRTEFLLGKVPDNPADSIFTIIHKLTSVGADVIGIPCNTAHAPEIFDPLKEQLKNSDNRVEIVHMIKEVAAFIKEFFPTIHKVGLLATNGTIQASVYQKVFRPEGLTVICPTDAIQDSKVHASIYDTQFGIKAQSSPVTKTAKETIIEAMEHLIEKGAECIILGCTEIPLAITSSQIKGRPILNPTFILARALIYRVAPDKLIPLPRI